MPSWEIAEIFTQDRPVPGCEKQVPISDGPVWGLLPLLSCPFLCTPGTGWGGLAGVDLHLAFENLLCHQLPKPNTLPQGSFPALFPVDLARYLLLPVSCFLLFPARLQLLGGTQARWSEVLQGR